MKPKHIPTILTAEEIQNCGYSPQRAAQMAESTATNWKAKNGGARKCPYGDKK